MLLKNALRYLGVWGKPDDKTKNLVLECIDEVKVKSMPRYVKKLYDYDGNRLVDGFVLEGKSVAKFLFSSKKVAVFCATLGGQIDIEIKKYQMSKMSRAAVFDACASAYLEEYCDNISKTLEEEAIQMGLYTTHRFSPGYGDLPMYTQKDILKELSAQRIGVALTEGFMLIPSKTVTAVVGYCETDSDNTHKCESCANKNCGYRSEI